MTKILSISDQEFIDSNVGTPRVKDVDITNTGTENVIVDGVSVDNSNFVVSGAFPQMTNPEIVYPDTIQHFFDSEGYIVDTDDGTGIKAGIGDAVEDIDLDITESYSAGSKILVSNRENTYLAQYSSNSAASFSDIGTEDNTRGVALSSTGKYGLIGGSNGFLYKILDGVVSVAIAVSLDWFECHVSDSGQYQLALSSAGYAFSNDYAATFTRFQTGTVFRAGVMNFAGQYMAVFPVSGTGYFSNNSGDTWVARSMTASIDKAVITPNGFDIYTGLNSGTGRVIKYSTNGASAITIRATGGSAILECANGGLVISARFNGIFMDVSINEGSTWTTISTGINNFNITGSKMSGDGSTYYATEKATNRIIKLQAPWTAWSYCGTATIRALSIDCTFDGSIVILCNNNDGAGSLQYSSNSGSSFTSKLSSSRIWERVAMSYKGDE